MLKLLLLTLSAWSMVSFSLFGALGLLLHRREQRALDASLPSSASAAAAHALALVRAPGSEETAGRRRSRPYLS
jgi:hypothetical protein